MEKAAGDIPAAFFCGTASAAVALVGGLVGVLIGILVLIGVLVLIAVLILGVLVVHEVCLLYDYPCGCGLIVAAPRGNMRQNYEKNNKIIVDRTKRLWYNTPENKEGRCIRPHLQQWQRG